MGAIKIALRLGDERFYKYIRAYGFGQQTGIELPGETRGMTKPPSRWSKVSIAAISMGQEIGISAIQLAGLISTFANDGVWTAPHIVAGTVQPQGSPQTVTFHPGASHRDFFLHGGRDAGDDAEGGARRHRPKSDSGRLFVGRENGNRAKSGPGDRSVFEDEIYWIFCRIRSAKQSTDRGRGNPRFCRRAAQGGQVSAPVFHRITQQVLEYLHVPHDLPLAPQHQLLLAAAKAKEKDLEEGTPDHLGEPLDTAEVSTDSQAGNVSGPRAFPAARSVQALPPSAGARTPTYASGNSRERAEPRGFLEP